MLKVTIVSPLEKYTAEQVTGLYLDTVTGQRGILQNHMPLVAQLKSNSLVRLQQESPQPEVRLRIGAGSFLKFANNEAVILTQSFAHEGY